MSNVSSSNSHKELVPRLRFPQFHGEWKVEKLSDFVVRVTRKNSNNETNLPLTISSKDGLVDQVTYFNKKVSSKDMSGYYLLKNGEFAYNKSYSVGYDFGAIKRLDNYPMGALSTLYICFALTRHNSDFIKVYFDSLKWYKEIYMIAAEGARNHGLLNIPTEDFFSTLHALPQDTNEQEKMAKFLMLIERRIDKQQRLVDNLKSYKRGLQQVVFREISHNIKLKDCVSFEPKSTIAAGDSCDEGKYILYRSGQKDGRTNVYTHNGVYIIANDGGEAKFKLTNGAFAYTDHCICLRAENDNLTILLANYLQMISSRITYEGFVGSGLKNIDRQYFGDIKMPIVANQQQAANSLILIDKFIEKQNALFDYLLTTKQAMLQQLFI